jgi:GMP synthase-like glutamine amidotransferase
VRIHFLQHIPYEFQTTIEKWAGQRGHAISKTTFYEDFKLPRFDEFDLLILLGGPMSIFDEDKYPWLKTEKRFVADAIEQDKLILGICFGAQVVAEALGARVYKNRYCEIGWHPVSLTEEAVESALFKRLPRTFMPFHCHEYTFDIPKHCIRAAESKGCANQGFSFRDRIFGIQFHIEPPIESLQRVANCCGHKNCPGKFMQSTEERLSDAFRLTGLHSIMENLMVGIEAIHNTELSVLRE